MRMITHLKITMMAFQVNENDNASQNNNDELLNAVIISDTGEVMDVKISVIDKDTPIY